jgi:hypothetical protein
LAAIENPEEKSVFIEKCEKILSKFGSKAQIVVLT